MTTFYWEWASLLKRSSFYNLTSITRRSSSLGKNACSVLTLTFSILNPRPLSLFRKSTLCGSLSSSSGCLPYSPLISLYSLSISSMACVIYYPISVLFLCISSKFCRSLKSLISSSSFGGLRSASLIAWSLTISCLTTVPALCNRLVCCSLDSSMFASYYSSLYVSEIVLDSS